MEIRVDTQRCIGAGNCSLTAPEIFDHEDDGTVKLLQPHAGEEHRNDVDEAIMLCPSQAISSPDQP
jgi:ferredoxin